VQKLLHQIDSSRIGKTEPSSYHLYPITYTLSPIYILGIETSCDETTAAIVENGTKVLCNVIASSRKDFADSGGVIPELAARKQVQCMIPVLEKALFETGMHSDNLDAIAVTKGPGLLGSLLVGVTAARVLSAVWKKPLIGIHHHLGHLSSIWLASTTSPPCFPCITLSVSGGHTELWYRESHTKNTLLGRTRDDAAGEAFDKGAALLGLPYPGGPAIADIAEHGDPFAYAFPLPLKNEDTLDFSFSGLKTSLKYLLRELQHNEKLLTRNTQKNLASSYQHAICMHLLDKLHKAVKKHPTIKEIHIVGGVSANQYLRQLSISNSQFFIRWPQASSYCTDNAAMIAAAAFFLTQENKEEVYENFITEACPAPLEG